MNSKEELKELPDKWYIFAKTEDKARFLFPHFNKLQGLPQNNGWSSNNTYHINDYCLTFDGIKHDSNHKSYTQLTSFTEISFEDFKRLVLKEETMDTNSTKEENKVIKISETLLFTYYNASQPHQKEYLTKHFQLDGSTTVGSIKGLYELACPDWKPKIKANHPDCFKEDRVWRRKILNGEGKKFYYLNDITEGEFASNSSSCERTNLVYTFTTQQEADNNALLYNTMMLMRSWAKFYNEVDEYKPTWSNDTYSKYGIKINYNKLEACYKYNENVFIFQTSVSSQKRAEEMLAEFKDDLEKLIQLGMFN